MAELPFSEIRIPSKVFRAAEVEPSFYRTWQGRSISCNPPAQYSVERTDTHSGVRVGLERCSLSRHRARSTNRYRSLLGKRPCVMSKVCRRDLRGRNTPSYVFTNLADLIHLSVCLCLSCPHLLVPPGNGTSVQTHYKARRNKQEHNKQPPNCFMLLFGVRVKVTLLMLRLF